MSKTSTGLPPGWAIKLSRTHKTEYYLNQSTNESSWVPPFGTDTAVLNEYVEKYRANGHKPVIREDGKVRVSHLLIKHNQSRRPRSWKSPDGITTTRDEAIQKLKQLQAKILNGEKLSELAESESDDSSHSAGGDLGFFGKGQMQPAFEEAAFGLNVGEISDIVETDSGLHLLERTG
ncbi:hypothetical protein G9P44_004768 [Scheffersomyces stipitis]|nr:hypothetical protein G9P44_004768 [Scheffersomyces stipitis]